ncbi:hypothetical protein HELRODRAFT_125408, partial [Helobdella robusta]|uniref:EGF-like calcium-binding domain-containing protein n=1 Tax=Helobdella robusta TaxID=6412 RepID=T1EH57_HELRO
ICVNTNGSFTCSCYSGYAVNGVNTNECDKTGFSFTTSSNCTNLDGGFECKCKDGYVKSNSGSCTDIDECQGLKICGAGNCTNTNGSYYCQCP